jgi:hypothetical protein
VDETNDRNAWARFSIRRAEKSIGLTGQNPLASENPLQNNSELFRTGMWRTTASSIVNLLFKLQPELSQPQPPYGQDKRAFRERRSFLPR